MVARISHRISFLTGLIVAGSLAQFANAAFTTPSWSRPTTLGQAMIDGTSYQSWNVFNDDDINTTAIEDSAPDVANINPGGTATVFEPGNGFVTGGGNIYSPTLVLDLTFTIPGVNIGTGQTAVLLQIKSLGGEMVNTNYPDANPVYDFSRIKINGNAIHTYGNFTYTELTRAALGGFGGYGVEHAFSFIVPSTASSFILNYQPLASSVSQDMVSIDTQVSLPEPSSLGAMSAAVMLLMRRRRD